MKRHLKRLASYKSWPVDKKSSRFLTRPLPGGHSFSLGVPLNILIRDVLKQARVSWEVKNILNQKGIKIDGKIRKNSRFLVGLMDVIEFPSLEEAYRIVINTQGKLKAISIPVENSNVKLCKIIGKKYVKKGMLQLNFHDGKNVLVKNDSYKIGDSVVVNIPENVVASHLKLEKGTMIYLTGGHYIGKFASVEDLRNEKIIFKLNGELRETLKKFAFVVGKDKPAVNLGEI
jgi:small subunit ribosomal protein S4e